MLIISHYIIIDKCIYIYIFRVTLMVFLREKICSYGVVRADMSIAVGSGLLQQDQHLLGLACYNRASICWVWSVTTRPASVGSGLLQQDQHLLGLVCYNRTSICWVWSATTGPASYINILLALDEANLIFCSISFLRMKKDNSKRDESREFETD